MAELKPTPKLQETQTLFEKGLLPTFKIGRDAVLQLSKVERTLFTDIEEAQSGNYIISGLNKKLSELDFTSFTFALGQILYNQSYQSGNEELNSGRSKKKANKISEQTGDTYYSGDIVTSLNELCRLANGREPNAEERKKMAATIDTCHKTPVEIKFPNGDKIESYVCVTIDKYTREKDGAILYNLHVNPIFGSRIQNQFGELPQDITAKLNAATKKRTAAHYLLLRWLSVQDKRYSHTLTIDTIVNELRMEDSFTINRGRAENHLLSICKTMVNIGILSSYEVNYTASGKRQRIKSITFNLNQNFIRDTKKKPKGKVDEP